MVPRHAVAVLLLLAVVAGLAQLRRTPAPVMPSAGLPLLAEPGDALVAGRAARAALFLGEYLAGAVDGRVAPDPVPGWHLAAAAFGPPAGLTRPQALEGLITLAASEAARTEKGIALLRRARAHAERADVTRALAAYDSAVVELPQLGDWIEVFAASAAATGGDTARVLVWQARAEPALVEWAWRVEPRARRQAGDRRGAIAAAESAGARLESPVRRAAAWSLAGQLRHERGEVAGARVAWIRALNTAEGSAAALDAARSLATLPGVTPAERLLIGRVLLRHGQAERGVQQLTAFIEWPAAPATSRDRAQYDVAMAAFRGGDNERAERLLRELAGRTADADLAAEALFTAGRAIFRSGRPATAIGLLRNVALRYPESTAAAQAAFLAADLLHDAHDVDGATQLYRAAIRSAPRSADAAAAHMRLGGLAFAEGRYEDALAQFSEFRRSHPHGRPRQQAAFWAGMAATRAGHDDDARRHFLDARDYDPFSYYGGLAADQLGEDAWQDRLEHAPRHSDRHDALARGALARIDLLRAAGWDDAAAFEMERVRNLFARIDGALYSLAEEMHRRGSISSGVSLAWDIHRREGAWNLRLLRILYPFPYHELILAEARARDVDPFLAAALIRQESMFNPGARSPVGAAGLMQVMPATARSMARRVSVQRFSPDMLVRPDINLAFGTTYLADQLRSYGDRLDLVLAAYNAGPGRVRRWQHFPEYADRLLFAERIPFEETRDYVRVVQNNRRLYAALYDTSPTRATD